MPSNAPLLATQGTIPAWAGAQNVSEMMTMTGPKPRRAMPGVNACASYSADSTLTA
jgi:hypothetical protein